MELEELLERKDIPKDAKKVISTNIAKIKDFKSKFRESNERYRMIVEKMQEGVLLENTEGKILFINPRTLKMLGYTEEELLEKHWSYIVVEEFIEKGNIETAKRPKGISSTYEVCCLAKDGRHIPVLITATPLFTKNNEFKGVLSVFTDITKRKQAESKLRESEERYRSYIDNASDIIFTITQEGILSSINPVIESLTGWSQKDLIGRHFSPSIIHMDDIHTVMDNLRIVLKNKHPTMTELRIKTKSGNYIPMEIKASPQIKDGEVIGLLGIARNITERYKAEEALRKSEEKYRSLVLNSLQGLVIIQDFPPKIVFVNPVMADLLGYSVEEILNFQPEDIYNLVPHDDRDFYFQRYKERLNGLTFQDEQEVRAKRKNGSEICMAIHTSQIEYLGKPAVQAAFVDITAIKKAEERLRLVKLEEERYHAMLSHFLNNDLQKIINNLDFLSLEYEYSQIFKEEIVKRIIEIASRSSKTIDTVNKILEVLQSPFDQKWKNLDLSEVINKAIGEISSIYHPIKVKSKNIDMVILADKYLKVIFNELFVYILNSSIRKTTIDLPIIIEGLSLPSCYCVLIRESSTQPISEEICLRLSGKITDEWEYQGHFIGISLTSVIMQHYGGSLEIRPSKPKGNEFRLNFPLKMINYRE